MQYDVLHVEDGIKFLSSLGSSLTSVGLTHQSASNLDDAKKLAGQNKYKIFVLDGQFPESHGMGKDFNFFALYDFLASMLVEKPVVLVWSNSTRVHEYCHEHGITYFSKKQMTPEEYAAKDRNPQAIAESRSAERLSQLIYEMIE